MQPRIETLPETKLVGKRIRTSFAENRTGELWQSFMPERGRIRLSTGPELYAVDIFDGTDFFREFNPSREFEKWAAMQVSEYRDVPSGMETLTVPAGLYAVFHYRGKASEARETFQFIYGTWIPGSDYELDNRPHFALMGEKYRNEDPESEEEFWVPITK